MEGLGLRVKDRKENGDCYSIQRCVLTYYPNKERETYGNERKMKLTLQRLGIWGFRGLGVRV